MPRCSCNAWRVCRKICFRLAVGGDLDQISPRGIEFRQWSGGFGIGLHSYADRVGAVVIALGESSAAMVAQPVSRRRAGRDVVDGFALGTGATTANAVDNFFDRQIVRQHGVEHNAEFSEDVVQRLGLTERARNSIQHESAAAAQTAGVLADHRHH